MKNILLGACTAGLTLSAGCLQDYNYVDPTESVLGSNMQLADGYLAGDFGDRTGFDGEATGLEGNIDRQYQNTSVNVVREQRGLGAGMIILHVSGNTLDRLAPGEHTFSRDEALSDQAIYVNVCGGQSASAFDYDQPASGTLTIEDSPNGLRTVDIQTEAPRLDVNGNETNEVEASTASFTFQLPPQG